MVKNMQNAKNHLKTSKTTNAKFVVVLLVVLAIFTSFLGMSGENNVKSILKTSKNCNTIAQSEGSFSKVESVTKCQAEATFSQKARQTTKGGVVIEATTKRVLFDEGMNVKCYPASTTKVLTALCVIENLPLEKIVTIPKEAVGVEGSSLYLKEGQKILVEDLLFGLMLRSGNDSAVALAIETSGTVEAFATLMNETAKKCGAVNSHFVNPHGLHDDNHFTTAYDLALITAKAYEYESFCRFAGAMGARITVDGEKTYIANKNKLLKLFEGANGVKTGFTKKSGRCLVGGAKRENMQLISVVLNYPDMWNDTVRMLKYGFDNYKMTSLDEALLFKQNASKTIEIFSSQNCAENWQNVKYPLRKDGSEYLQIKSA